MNTTSEINVAKFLWKSKGQYNVNQLNLLQYVQYNKLPSENISPQFCRNKCLEKEKDIFCINRDFLKWIILRLKFAVYGI